MKYPIGIQNFEKIIDNDYVYVDKTALVYDLVHNGKKKTQISAFFGKLL